MSAPKQIVVTQADRDTAAEYVRDNQRPRLEREVRKGVAYVGLSEAFARHRIAATRASEARIAGLVEALCEWLKHHADCDAAKSFSVFGRPSVCCCGLDEALRAALATTTEGEKG